jgi:hypothetical protein
MAVAEAIRPYRAADLDGAEAANDAVGWGQRRVLLEFYGARDDTALFVAEVDGAIVGTGGATVFPGPPATGWVHGIVVRPEYQRPASAPASPRRRSPGSGHAPSTPFSSSRPMPGVRSTSVSASSPASAMARSRGHQTAASRARRSRGWSRGICRPSAPWTGWRPVRIGAAS